MNKENLKKRILETLYEKRGPFFQDVTMLFAQEDEDIVHEVCDELLENRYVSYDEEVPHHIMLKITTKGCEHLEEMKSDHQQNKVKTWLQVGILGAGVGMFALALTVTYAPNALSPEGFRAEVEFSESEEVNTAYFSVESYLLDRGNLPEEFNIEIVKDEDTQKIFLLSCKEKGSCQFEGRMLTVQLVRDVWTVVSVEEMRE